MVFSSIVFLFYFLPLFLLVYHLVPRQAKNVVILLSSIFFYAWGAPRFIFVILGTTLLDFFLVRWMDATNHPLKRKLLLCLPLLTNLGLLFYFKYSNFFVENLNVLFEALGMATVPWAKLILPIGISFYTFESVTYAVDVYRRVHAPLRNFWHYQLYIIFFPKLIAGPIVRYHDIADQITGHTRAENSDDKLRGMYRFAIGLAKKVLIGNVLGAQADAVFGTPAADLSTAAAWWGALCYTFQIYFDFSGYSDMAIGLSRVMGFRLPENFNNPYTATSITDFWRRWHITLGAWMRNYLYIPLGGNRAASRGRVFLNLWIVFLASGLWHGAAWGFVVWGAYHGLFLVLERLAPGRWLARLGKGAVVYTFFVVLVGWVFFRLESLGPSLDFLGRMFSAHPGAVPEADAKSVATMALAALFSFFTLSRAGRVVQDAVFYRPYRVAMHAALFLCSIVMIIVSAASITASGFNPFIYFRF